MAIHVQKMTTDVTAVDGDMPLSQEQMEQLVEYVAKRIEEKHEHSKYQDHTSEIQASVIQSW